MRRCGVVQNGTSPHVILSRTGAQQGCTFGSLLWAAGWQEALEDFATRSDFAVSFIDDGSFGLDPAAAAPLLLHIAKVAKEHGGELNLSKCVAYSTQELPTDLRDLGVKCIDPNTPAAARGFVIQGVPIGHPDFVHCWLDENLASQKEFMRRLAEYVPSKFAAAQLLHYCVTPRIGHILRALPPQFTEGFAAAFDEACVSCFTAIAAPDYSAIGLPAVANAKLRLKLRDGGLDIATQARTCAAAYVASWATARPLILRLCPSLAPNLPPDFDFASLPDPPAPILHLQHAITSLPLDAAGELRDFLTAQEAADPSVPAGKTPPLQRMLSRPFHDQFTADFVQSIAADRAASAKHLSQTGFLGSLWFKRINRPGVHFIDNSQFLLGVALHLSLPVAAFEGCTCGCNLRLSAATGPLHVQSCSQFGKLERSETFQHAFDSIIYDLPGNVWIEGAKRTDGKATRCAAYATVPVTDRQGEPVLDAHTGLPKLKDIIPDRVAGGVIDGMLGPSGRYVIDTCIVAPECPSYSTSAATTALHAAGTAHATKLRTYTPHLRTGDHLLPVVCETWGGLHASVEDKIRQWARLGSPEDEDPDTFATDTLGLWRMRLSVALFHSRVGYISSVLRKLRGVPARSLTVAHNIANPFRRALELGRLGGR